MLYSLSGKGLGPSETREMVRKALVSRRKSPRQNRSMELVGSILSATTRILETGGYAMATTNKIAELAGVSIGSLYQYFPSKEALVAAIFEQQLERSFKKFEARLKENDGKSLDELIAIMVQTAADTYLPNRKLMAVLFEKAPELEKIQYVLRMRAHITDLLRQVLERFRGEVRPKNLDLSLFVAVNAVIGVFQTALLSYPKNTKDDELVRELTAMVRRYFI